MMMNEPIQRDNVFRGGGGNGWRDEKNDVEMRIEGARRIASIIQKGSSNHDDKREYRVLVALEHLCYQAAESKEEYMNPRLFEILLHRVASEKAKRRRDQVSNSNNNNSSSSSTTTNTVNNTNTRKVGIPIPTPLQSGLYCQPPASFQEMLFHFLDINPHQQQHVQQQGYELPSPIGETVLPSPPPLYSNQPIKRKSFEGSTSANATTNMFWRSIKKTRKAHSEGELSHTYHP